MENCSFCGDATPTEISGVPICGKCSDDFDQRESRSRFTIGSCRTLPQMPPIIAHALLGVPECPGCLIARTEEGRANILCGECGAIILSGVLPEDIGAARDALLEQSSSGRSLS